MATPESVAASYQFLREYIAGQTGIELGPDRQYLVESRLEPVMEEVGCQSLAELCVALLRENQSVPSYAHAAAPIRRKIIHALSTHETSFFRDPDLFALLQSRLLKQLSEENGCHRLRMWSAAASSGQEAYSLAMCALETGVYAPPLIFASDVSAIVIEAASRGCFTDYELLRGMDDPVLRQRYFVPIKGGAQVKPEIRALIEFSCADLREPPNAKFAPLDLILCRNVMIYFEEETRLQVLSHLRDQLRQGGILILGAAETVWSHFVGLERIQEGNTAFYRRIE
ncbi:MAG: CheR family methyltransferase [Acidobacteriota bacterium]|jgi:chemotaxis protein methyltransferase CheR